MRVDHAGAALGSILLHAGAAQRSVAAVALSCPLFRVCVCMDGRLEVYHFPLPLHA
jgi:hypothetical protein